MMNSNANANANVNANANANSIGLFLIHECSTCTVCRWMEDLGSTGRGRCAGSGRECLDDRHGMMAVPESPRESQRNTDSRITFVDVIITYRICIFI